MKNFIILPDAASDLTEEMRNKFGITDFITAHIVLPDGREVDNHLTWDFMDAKTFYASLKKDNKYSTSPASVEEVKAKFKHYLDLGYDILSISLSGGLSGTYNFTVKAKEEIEKDYPNNKIVCVDSHRYSLAYGAIVCKAAQLKQEGKSFDEIVDYINENRETFHQMGVMDDLFFLARKGRVSNAKAFMGSLIGIKPLGDIDDKGMTTILGKAKGFNKAIKCIIKYIEETIIDPQKQYIYIAHTQREKEANELKRLVIEKFHPLDVYMVECFATNGINIGPGLYGVYYQGKKISKDLVVEKGIIQRLLKTK